MGATLLTGWDTVQLGALIRAAWGSLVFQQGNDRAISHNLSGEVECGSLISGLSPHSADTSAPTTCQHCRVGGDTVVAQEDRDGPQEPDRRNGATRNHLDPAQENKMYWKVTGYLPGSEEQCSSSTQSPIGALLEKKKKKKAGLLINPLAAEYLGQLFAKERTVASTDIPNGTHYGKS